MVGRPGVHGYDPLRLAIDVRGTGASGYQVARLMHERDDINLELAGENVIVAVFGMAETAADRAARGWSPRSSMPWSTSAATRRRERGQLRAAAALGPARDDTARGVPRAARRWCR